MRQREPVLAATLEEQLTHYEDRALPGIDDPIARACFINQIIDSVRRIKYIETVDSKSRDRFCIDPTNVAFNPFGAILCFRDDNNIDDAMWLTFLITHFGKHKIRKWELLRNVYGKLGANDYWTWNNVCNNQQDFINWLDANQNTLKLIKGFSNHRKYQSLDALKPYGTGATIMSYINWVGHHYSHATKIEEITQQCGENPSRHQLFREFYNSLNSVVGFGRTAKFDFLTMAGKLKLLDIEPDSTYMTGATGPLDGARQLFGVNTTRQNYEIWLSDLEEYLGLYFGMQVLEDALCNWQKNPLEYHYFSG